MITALARLIERWTQWEARQCADPHTDIAQEMLRAKWTFQHEGE
jgi:hypothetical protein